MTSTQTKIEKIVTTYIELFPDEFEAFKKGMRAKRDNLKTDFAETKGMDTFDRLLFEIPATLHTMIHGQLTTEEFDYYQSKKGSHWFASKFKVFLVGKSV